MNKILVEGLEYSKDLEDYCIDLAFMSSLPNNK